MAPKSPTLHEVASRAGVSIATVSRVARGLDQISPETRTRVLAAIKDLNYRPSHFGRALVKQQHGTLGIVFPGLRGPYFSEAIHGFEIEAIAARMSLLILGTERLPKADAQVLGMADRADGIAVWGGSVDDSLLDQLAHRGVPLVTIARPSFSPDIPNTRVDNVESTRALVTHLIADHDYTDLAFVGTVAGSPDGVERWEAFRQAHADAGLSPVRPPLTVGWEQTSGVRAAIDVLHMHTRPRALVCANDEIATGILSTFAARNVRVPDDIAVTGWDDGPYAHFATPSLTTVSQPSRELGSHSARVLISLINNQSVPDTDVVLPTHAVFRASCGCRFDPVSALDLNGNHPVDPAKGAPPTL